MNEVVGTKSVSMPVDDVAPVPPGETLRGRCALAHRPCQDRGCGKVTPGAPVPPTVPGEFTVRLGEGGGGLLILSVLEVTRGFNRFQIADGFLILAENEVAGSSGSVVIDAKDPEDVRSVGMFKAPNDWQFHNGYHLGVTFS